MKLLDLEVQKVRGVKSLSLSVGGSNLVIWGPNGSGKSAVVDALDFLLTGRISRLEGEGTGGISLGRHGPHIDHKPREAIVTARIEIPGYPEPITIRRRMSAPARLEYPAAAEKVLRPILTFAEKGQHVLSRRDILKFVAAEAGKRAQQIQSLLNLSEIENIRRSFTRVLNSAETEESAASSSLRSAESWITNTLVVDVFTGDGALNKVNELRRLLGADAINYLHSRELKKDVSFATRPDEPAVNADILERDVEGLFRTLDSSAERNSILDGELRMVLQEIKGNEEAQRDLARLRLFEYGVSLIDDSGACPFCDTAWPPGQLKDRIDGKIREAVQARQEQDRIRNLANRIRESVETCHNYLEKVIAAAARMSRTAEVEQLSAWLEELLALSEDLGNPLEKYATQPRDPVQIKPLFATDQRRDACRTVASEAARIGTRRSPEATAWETLTRLEENLKAREAAAERYRHATRILQRAQVADAVFVSARDTVLTGLYEQIQSRFSSLYRMINAEDEGSFTSSLRHSGAGLHLEVEFYGRGTYPPIALHSEGHQDTMGLVLYLALAERLSGTVISLTVLDDVVMSVDSGHRRHICKVLASEFPDRQFLITTHDRTWARELELEGVVPRRNVVEFTKWNIDTGPFVAMEANLWERIEEDMRSGDIPSAAARLRRGMEQYFEVVSDSLRARVRYRSDGRWELSDFASAAIAEFLELLRKAKKAANSWGKRDLVESLSEQETVAKQVLARSQAEQWAINPAVHYNRWLDFSAPDFRPVVDAMRDLFELFRCAKCGGVLVVTSVGTEASDVRCPCGSVQWNLLKKQPA